MQADICLKMASAEYSPSSLNFAKNIFQCYDDIILRGGIPMIGWWKLFLNSIDLLFQPERVLGELAESQDLRPGVIALAVTSLLFAVSSVVSHRLGIPMTAEPIFPLPAYRLVQAIFMPLVIASGCCLCAFIGSGLGKLLLGRSDFRRLLAVSAPALLVPLWPMLWPTEMAVSLGLLSPAMKGFPGLWTRELAPAFSFLYITFMLWLGFWQAQKVLLREAFGMAVLSLIPTLGWWAILLR